MASLLIVFGFGALLLSYLALGGFRLWAERRQILDFPNERSAHDWPVARGGGVVIVAVTLPGLWIATRALGQPTDWPALFSYTVGAVLVANVSWLDDLRPLPNWVRLGVHCAAAALAVYYLGYWSSFSLPL
ncbi:MAG TPA: hypothetical protein VE398_00915, partial [Acidobacteriota bacterium]|nr:hypothetical protein [Acidobacteriota bacterium]